MQKDDKKMNKSVFVAMFYLFCYNASRG